MKPALHSSLFGLVPVVTVAFLGLGGALAFAGCSATVVDGTSDGGVTCDSSKCAPGNTCLEVNGETKCRKTCSSNLDPSKSCPLGYACRTQNDPTNAKTVEGPNPPAPASTAFCAEVAPTITKQAKGQWGFACNPGGGVSGNKDCDSAQGFTCLARSPSDGDAYCTHACETTADCGAGLFCGDINDTPSADAAKREGFGSVIRVCQKRAYGSPCFADVDCPSAHTCAADNNGRRFCTIACEKDNNCAVDAFCAPVNGKNICFPNAGVILGDGKFCSPCRADSDCKAGGGVCASDVSYTTERFCTVPSPSACKTTSDCPKAPEGVTAAGCASKESDELPAGSCVGLFKLGGNDLPGCWTAPRKANPR